MTNKLPHYLGDQTYFRNLSETILDLVKSVAVQRSYIPGTQIILEGNACNSAYFIIKGEVNINRTSPDGRNQVLARLGPGHWFNFVSCIVNADTNPSTVTAKTPIKAYIISDNDLRQLVHNHQELALVVMYDLADRVRHLSSLVESLALLPTRSRVARFLLDHADEDGYIQWDCTQEDIAERLGTVSDVVGRVLRTFVDEGLIEMPSRHFVVLRDVDALEREAKY